MFNTLSEHSSEQYTQQKHWSSIPQLCGRLALACSSILMSSSRTTAEPPDPDGPVPQQTIEPHHFLDSHLPFRKNNTPLYTYWGQNLDAEAQRKVHRMRRIFADMQSDDFHTRHYATNVAIIELPLLSGFLEQRINPCSDDDLLALILGGDVHLDLDMQLRLKNALAGRNTLQEITLIPITPSTSLEDIVTTLKLQTGMTLQLSSENVALLEDINWPETSISFAALVQKICLHTKTIPALDSTNPTDLHFIPATPTQTLCIEANHLAVGIHNSGTHEEGGSQTLTIIADPNLRIVSINNVTHNASIIVHGTSATPLNWPKQKEMGILTKELIAETPEDVEINELFGDTVVVHDKKEELALFEDGCMLVGAEFIGHKKSRIVNLESVRMLPGNPASEIEPALHIFHDTADKSISLTFNEVSVKSFHTLCALQGSRYFCIDQEGNEEELFPKYIKYDERGNEKFKATFSHRMNNPSFIRIDSFKDILRKNSDRNCLRFHVPKTQESNRQDRD